MPCDISLGRLKPCKDSVGGIKNVYFINYGTLGDIDYDVTNTDVIDSLDALGTATNLNAYKYDVHFSSSFTQNVQSSTENGTTAFEQVLEITMPRLTKEDHKEIKMLAWGHPIVAIEDQNGNVFIGGLENGMEVTGGTIVTGMGMSDLSGYTLTLTGMEKVPANFLGVSLTDAGATIVTGT
jgi:hypothetical protein